MRLFRIEQLQPGMVLAQDVIRMDGRALIMHLKPGEILDQKKILRLHSFDFDALMVEDDNYPGVHYKKYISDELRETCRGMLQRLFLKIEKKPSSIDKNELLAFTPIIRDMIYELRDLEKISPIQSLKKETEYIADHALNTVLISAAVAKAMKTTIDIMEKVMFSALFYDIGMLFIPKSLYTDRKVISEHERIDIARHTELGFDFLSRFQLSGIGSLVAYTALRHHERINGSGYPGGRLLTAPVNVVAQICGIADHYIALISDRPYRIAFSRHEAVRTYIQHNDAFSRHVRDAFMASIILFPDGASVRLNAGDEAVVLNQNTDPFRPVVQSTNDGSVHDLAVERKRRIDDCFVWKK